MPLGDSDGSAFQPTYNAIGEPESDPWFAPSTADSFGYLISLIFMYLSLAWYFGQVVGAKMSFFFIFDATYWGFRSPTTGFVPGDTLAQVQSESRRDMTLRTHKMSKAYDGNTALRELSLELKQGKVLGLLGHNGAGKSTAIGCMTGVHNPTHGEGKFLNRCVFEPANTHQACYLNTYTNFFTFFFFIHDFLIFDNFIFDIIVFLSLYQLLFLVIP